LKSPTTTQPGIPARNNFITQITGAVAEAFADTILLYSVPVSPKNHFGNLEKILALWPSIRTSLANIKGTFPAAFRRLGEKVG